MQIVHDELLLVKCSARLDCTQRKLCRQISSAYVEQNSWFWSPSEVDTMPDHYCFRRAQNRSGSLGISVCGLWTSPAPACVMCMSHCVCQYASACVKRSRALNETPS